MTSLPLTSLSVYFFTGRQSLEAVSPHHPRQSGVSGDLRPERSRVIHAAHHQWYKNTQPACRDLNFM